MYAIKHLWWVSIASGNGLVQSAITWTDLYPDLCCHMSSLGHNELNDVTVTAANSSNECLTLIFLYSVWNQDKLCCIINSIHWKTSVIFLLFFTRDHRVNTSLGICDTVLPNKHLTIQGINLGCSKILDESILEWSEEKFWTLPSSLLYKRHLRGQ